MNDIPSGIRLRPRPSRPVDAIRALPFAHLRYGFTLPKYRLGEAARIAVRMRTCATTPEMSEMSRDRKGVGSCGRPIGR
jgi:hypothetical protein